MEKFLFNSPDCYPGSYEVDGVWGCTCGEL
ncbi:MAG: hypothetical protein QOE61_2179 [Micromonosporaceae bacterium]|nr:hypothetical protein [Micromonosporaceae bacterium]